MTPIAPLIQNNIIYLRKTDNKILEFAKKYFNRLLKNTFILSS